MITVKVKKYQATEYHKVARKYTKGRWRKSMCLGLKRGPLVLEIEQRFAKESECLKFLKALAADTTFCHSVEIVHERL